MFKLTRERNCGGIVHYTYGFDGITVTFNQEDNGSIYGVLVHENEKLSGIYIYAEMNMTDDRSYPETVYFKTDSEYFAAPKDVDEYIEKLLYANKVCIKIAEIFKSEKHSTRTVRELVEDKVNEVFLTMQDSLKITSGDIAPSDAIRLGELQEQLASHIEKVLETQREEKNE